MRTGTAVPGLRAQLAGSLKAALRDGRAVAHDHDGVEVVRLRDRVGKLDRGTVLLDGRVVPTYPHIGRVFVLKEGIAATFDGPFSVEEKIDGYNVRVVRHEGRLLPLARGGGVCPFTVDRLPDLGDLDPIFDEHPDVVLCCEVAGPNPYLLTDPPRARGELKLFVFDLMAMGAGDFLELAERDELISRYGLPKAPVLGVHGPDEADAVAEHVRRLDGEGGEGIVMKALTGPARAKYVTPSINLLDLELDAPLIPELPGEFFTSRLIRLALGLDEIGCAVPIEELEQRLGHALVRGLRDALRDVRKTGTVSRRFTVRVRNRETAAKLVEHIDSASRSVQARQVSLQPSRNGGWELTFDKIFQASTSRLHTWLRGQLVVD